MAATGVGPRAARGIRPLVGSLVVASGWTSACVDYVPLDVPPEEPVPVVFSVVEAGRDSVFVGLGRVGPGTATGPEPGATLTLESPAGSGVAREVDPVALDCRMPEGFSCYVAVLPEPVAAGDSVRMTGVLTGGAKIVAATRVPGPLPVRVDGHPPGDTVRYVDGSDGWPTLDVPAGTTLRIIPRDEALDVAWWDGADRGFCSGATPNPAPYDLRSRFLDGPPRIYLQDPWCDGSQRTSWDSLATSLVFLGYDRHATDWHDHFGGVWRDGGERWGVVGALGVFGSLTPGAFALRVLARTP